MLEEAKLRAQSRANILQSLKNSYSSKSNPSSKTVSKSSSAQTPQESKPTLPSQKKTTDKSLSSKVTTSKSDKNKSVKSVNPSSSKNADNLDTNQRDTSSKSNKITSSGSSKHFNQLSDSVELVMNFIFSDEKQNGSSRQLTSDGTVTSKEIDRLRETIKDSIQSKTIQLENVSTQMKAMSAEQRAKLSYQKQKKLSMRQLRKRKLYDPYKLPPPKLLKRMELFWKKYIYDIEKTSEGMVQLQLR